MLIRTCPRPQKGTVENNIDTDQMPHNVAFDECVHIFHKIHDLIKYGYEKLYQTPLLLKLDLSKDSRGKNLFGIMG